MLFGFCNENQRVLFGFCNENKGIWGVAKWQNACIIKAKFGQIDLGPRTWWLLSEAVILKATFLCLKDRELLPFPRDSTLSPNSFFFSTSKENVHHLPFIKTLREQSTIEKHQYYHMKEGSWGDRKPSLLSFLQSAAAQENPGRYWRARGRHIRVMAQCF